MAKDMRELQKQIAEKNKVLDSFRHEDNSNSEKIRRVRTELDKLLYLYLKALKCNCESATC